mmetsp:Transcript_3923/g.9954  ORF Transcript_3923/g.9954 Transcript_3923/m.9954 type:complete len:108 (+) Transcript_3923:328-651(+)
MQIRRMQISPCACADESDSSKANGWGNQSLDKGEEVTDNILALVFNKPWVFVPKSRRAQLVRREEMWHPLICLSTIRRKPRSLGFYCIQNHSMSCSKVDPCVLPRLP